ncbi:hypothetical protein [Amycolatopsis pigmentata]|uniref:Uncharacterized protein n=1 Tax=Amycolatopsis pigmentata TaxID=450801 RepID=A0ABW5FQR5_9PSEU
MSAKHVPLPETLPPPFSFSGMLAELFGESPSDEEAEDFAPPALTPLRRPVEESTLGLFVSCGVYHRSQEPLGTVNDLSYRLIDRDMPYDELILGHGALVRKFAVGDLNVAYPRERLVELEREGVFRALAPQAVSMVGAIGSYTDLMRRTVPAIAAEFERQGVDLVLLLPFCPKCHTTVSLIARGLETRGLPTVMTSCNWEVSQAIKAPRTAFLDFPMGCPAGKPGEPALQREVLRTTLRAAPDFAGPWRPLELPFSWSPDGSRAWEKEIRDLYANDAGFAARRAAVESTVEKLAGQEDEFVIRCDC